MEMIQRLSGMKLQDEVGGNGNEGRQGIKQSIQAVKWTGFSKLMSFIHENSHKTEKNQK